MLLTLETGSLRGRKFCSSRLSPLNQLYHTLVLQTLEGLALTGVSLGDTASRKTPLPLDSVPPTGGNISVRLFAAACAGLASLTLIGLTKGTSASAPRPELLEMLTRLQLEPIRINEPKPFTRPVRQAPQSAAHGLSIVSPKLLLSSQRGRNCPRSKPAGWLMFGGVGSPTMEPIGEEEGTPITRASG